MEITGGIKMGKLVKVSVIAGLVSLCAFTLPDVKDNITNIQQNVNRTVKAETRQDKKIYKYRQDKKKTSKFSSIKAECNSLDIVIDKSGSKDFYISYNLNCKNSSNPVSYKVEDGVLYIKETKLEWPSAHVYINKWDKLGKDVNYKNYINKVYVHIPSDINLKNIGFDTGSGDLYIKNISVEDGKFNTESGDLDITGSKITGSVDIRTGSGDVDIDKSDINKIFKIKTESGDIEVYNSSVNAQLYVNAGSGDVDIDKSLINKTFKIKTESGDIEAYNSKVKGKLDIQTSTGDVDIANLDISGNTDIQTSGGDVDMMFNKKNIEKLGITMTAKDGDMHVDKSYKGTKKKKGDSYVYVRNVNGDKTTKPFLNVTSVWGAIELN